MDQKNVLMKLLLLCGLSAALFISGCNSKGVAALKKATPIVPINEYEKMLDDMKGEIINDKNKISRHSDKITTFLLNCINEHGTFDEEMLRKIEKLFRQKIGSQVGRVLRMGKR